MIADTAKEHLTTRGADEAIAYLESQSDAKEVADAYDDLMRHAYWERKDLTAAIRLGGAGISRCLRDAESLAATKPDEARRATRWAQMMANNLSSFAWPGWNEPGIKIGREEQEIGLQAGRQSLELVERLGLGDLQRARGNWMVAVHELARGNYAEARQLLKISAAHAAQTDSRGDHLLAKGFGKLAEILEGKGEAQAQQAQLEQINKDLAEVKDGQEFVTQIETAEKLWRQNPPRLD